MTKRTAQEILDGLPELTPEQRAQLDDLGDWITEENPGYFFTEEEKLLNYTAQPIKTKDR